jgi:hypothetical protein
MSTILRTLRNLRRVGLKEYGVRNTPSSFLPTHNTSYETSIRMDARLALKTY